MGIPSYFKHIISKYDRIFKKRQSISKIDNLYIDSNSIIYDSLRSIDIDETTNKESFERDLIMKVFEKILEYISKTSPRKNVIISFDGVVPLAKIEQQRQRRYKSALTSRVENMLKDGFLQGIKDEDKKKDYLTKSSFKWDQTAITPGTIFMNTLNDTLKYMFREYEINQENTPNIIFSGSDEVGEGEHKIFEYIRNHNHGNDITCVYGLDADLIMLSLNHLKYNKQIYLLREKPSYGDELDDIYDENELMFMSINHLANCILEMMVSVDSLETLPRNVKLDKIQDYMFISFMLGNDFMPHFPALNIRNDGIDVLFNHYKTCFNDSTTIIKHDKIIWKNLRKLMEMLSISEESLIIKQTNNMLKEEKSRLEREISIEPSNKEFNQINKDVSDKNEQLEEKIDTYIEKQMYSFSLIPTKNRIDERYISPTKDNNKWKSRYYRRLFNINYNNKDEVKEICMNYIEGLEWCYLYYNEACRNTMWKYNYAYPPLIEDLWKHIPIFETSFIETDIRYVDEIVQLCYVIPEDGFSLITKKIGDKLKETYPENYNDNLKYKWAFCKYFWESHVSFPEIDIDDFSKLVFENK